MSEKKKFDINHWLNNNEPTKEPVKKQSISNNQENDTETIIRRIEDAHIDITANYTDWRDIGFAFADELGEAGRDCFHRVSRFHPEYSQSESDKQYDKCLKANGNGVSIKSFYHLAQQAGISLRTVPPISTQKPQAKKIAQKNIQDESEENEVIFNTPQIPSEIYEQLPEILKESAEMFQDAIEKDVFLIGAISVISGCLPNVQGIYFDEPVSAHLYSFITAPAGSGKGKLKWTKYFGLKIHKSMVEQSNRAKEEYEQELENYNNLNKNQRQDVERPKEPKRKMFYIPANSSSSAFIQALSDNDFKGIIFETEADTLAGTLKQDWGNFSDVLRKAFHHESTNMFRRKDNEHIEVEDPHLAIALSGTPKQVQALMPDTENGLFSRFLYYAFEDYSDFKNPFISHQKVDYTQFFESKGEQIYDLYQFLSSQPKPYSFSFTEVQGTKFTEFFKDAFIRNRLLIGNDFNANTRRLGLITFRIAMVLRTLRILDDGNYSNPLWCSDTDFQTAIKIAFTLEKHAIAVFQNLPNNNLKGIKLKFYNALPESFNRQGYLSAAKKLNIKDKTAEKYIGQFKERNLLNHSHNSYQKSKS